jgi:putative SOS response-associated peptidase YedK
LARWFKTTGLSPNVQQRYNAAPTQDLPVVIRDRETGERRLEALRWGLIPFWAKDAKIGFSTINADNMPTLTVGKRSYQVSDARVTRQAVRMFKMGPERRNHRVEAAKT